MLSQFAIKSAQKSSIFSAKAIFERSLSLQLLFSLGILSSCYLSISQKEKKKNLQQPPSLEKITEDSLATPYFNQGNWPQKKWWESFDSPDLDGIIEEALQSSPTLQQAYCRVEKSRQTSLVARAPLFPWASLGATDDKIYLSKNGLYRAFNPLLPLNGNLTNLFGSLEYDLDIWGKNRQLYHAALGNTRAQLAETAQVELVLTTAVASSYIALKVDYTRNDLLEQLIAKQTQLLLLGQNLKNSSLLSAVPLLVLEEKLLAYKQLRELVEERIALDKHMLNNLIGHGPEDPICISEELPSLPDTLTIPEELSLDLVARRPDIMARIWQAEALSHEVGAAITDFYPNISFMAQGGTESLQLQNLLSAQSLTYSFTPAIHLPIFTAGAIKANVQTKMAAFNEAVFAYNQIVLSSAQEIADCLATGKSIYRRRKDQQALVQRSKKREEITSVNKKSGLNNQVDLLQVQIEVIQAELEDLDLLFGQYMIVIQLIKALGGGYETSCSMPL